MVAESADAVCLSNLLFVHEILVKELCQRESEQFLTLRHVDMRSVKVNSSCSSRNGIPHKS